jgi:hypothetical protein
VNSGRKWENAVQLLDMETNNTITAKVLGEELLASIQQMNAGLGTVVHSAVLAARQKSGLSQSQSQFANLHTFESSSSLGLAVTHLNASVGNVLTTDQLSDALRNGSVDAIADSPTAAALLRYLFVELDPRLIVLCAYEAGTDVAHANMVYQDNLRHTMPRVPAWEKSIEFLL